MANEDTGYGSLPDTLGTVPALLKGYGQKTTPEARGEYARQQLPELLTGSAKATAEQKFGEFERDQGVLQKTAEAERGLARGARMETEKLDSGIQPYKEFEQPEYKASDYAANAASRILSAVVLGGIARTSAEGQLKAIREMQDAEDRGLVEQFQSARLKFDQAEKARQESNKMLKDRFDRMMDLLGKDRNAALVEAKLIEGNLGKGIIAAQLRSGNYAKAYELFNKATETADKIALERAKQAAKPAKIEQLPAALEKSLDTVGKANVALNRANQTREKNFFGIAPSDAVADLIVSGVEKGLPVGDVMRSLGVDAPKVTRDAVEWWKDYQSFVAQVRNQLFGATLTPREAGDFRKFTIGPATAPEVADDYFNRQIQIINQAVERERKKGRARGVSDETLSSYLDLPTDEVVPSSRGGSPAPAPAAGPRPKTFANEAEAQAAFDRNEIKKGDEIIVGGVRGNWE